MSKLSEFFGRKSFASTAERAPTLLSGWAQNGGAERGDAHLDEGAFSEAGTRIGEENEALRNLVIETARKISELDELKQTFGRLIDPVNKTLRTLEQEKSHNSRLAAKLNETRAAMETVRVEFHQADKKASSLETNNERLKEELEVAQQTIRGLETTRIELTNEIATKRTEIGNLEHRLAEESAFRQSLSDDNLALREQGKGADKRIAQLEAETATVGEKLVLANDDRRSLQTSLDQAVGDVSRLSRQLTESGNALTAAQTRVGKLETMFAETDTERAKLAAALDEAKERHRSESSTQGMRLEALQSRATTAEKLLVEARQNLMVRAEEVRAFDRKAIDATIARNAAEKRLGQLDVLHETQDRQIKDLEQSRAALVERSTALIKNLKARETGLTRAEEKIQALTDQVSQLEADIEASRSNAENRTEELNSMLQGERMDRAVAEGALEATRKDNARLQREVTALQAALRRGNLGDEAPLVPKAKRIKSSDQNGVEPIIKA
jgi:chromosome segregation ATPase